MSRSWRLTSLRAAGVSLIDCEHRTPPAAQAGLPYIAIPQLKEGRLDLSDVRLISEKHFQEWTRKASPTTHDVILSRRCNPGETSVVPSGLRCALGQNLVLLRADGTHVYPPFLRWWVRSPAWWEQIGKFLNVGAIFDSLKCADVPNFELPLPPLPEQKAIASILGALDDKIDLNRRTNETLEELARTIFKSWFVDFDPVKAKAEGRQPEGMDAETAKLFPSRFVESELGMIPEGWTWIPFARTGLWVSGGTPNTKTSSYWGGSIPWFSAKSMGPLWLSHSDDLLTEEGAQNGTRLVPRRSVLFIVRGMSLATEWRIGITTRDVTLNQDLKAIVDDGTVLPELVLLWLLVNREVIRAKADEAGHGTKRLPTTVLHAHSLALPPRREQEALSPSLAGVLSKIELNLAESRTLAELRDLLLPKLISGELRVPDAEKLTEGVL